MKQVELDQILKDHGKWLCGEGGERANLRRANLSDADLRRANLRYANLRYANLRYANLSNAYLRGANLSNAYLSDANLSDADLRGANLSDANLRGANLSDANLSDADLWGANLSDADLPGTIKVENLFTKIKAAIDNGGELEMSDWHGCKAHCMAGWVITFAGLTGKVAENLVGTPWAAALIINQSCPYLEGKVPNFYASNEDAMKFINECGEKEALDKI